MGCGRTVGGALEVMGLLQGLGQVWVQEGVRVLEKDTPLLNLDFLGGSDCGQLSLYLSFLFCENKGRGYIMSFKKGS